MRGSKPAVEVPAELFLAMARAYKQQPQERCEKGHWFEVDLLERRAYRKLAQKRASENA